MSISTWHRVWDFDPYNMLNRNNLPESFKNHVFFLCVD